MSAKQATVNGARKCGKCNSYKDEALFMKNGALLVSCFDCRKKYAIEKELKYGRQCRECLITKPITDFQKKIVDIDKPESEPIIKNMISCGDCRKIFIEKQQDKAAEIIQEVMTMTPQ